MKIRLSLVISAIESASEFSEEFYDTETGETLWINEMASSREEIDAATVKLENSPGRYLRFPTQYEIHTYRIMEDFIDSLPDENKRRELEFLIRGSGAFRRFKWKIREYGIEQQWYDYLAAAHREIAIRWCRDNDLEYTDD